MIESTTAVKCGWGSMPYRSVSFLSVEERAAVRAGQKVFFRFTPFHPSQSGYKVVFSRGRRFDSREPTLEELVELKRQCDRKDTK